MEGIVGQNEDYGFSSDGSEKPLEDFEQASAIWFLFYNLFPVWKVDSRGERRCC